MSDATDFIAPDGWQHILEPGEIILWQGRPDLGARAALARLTDPKTPPWGLIGGVCIAIGFLLVFYGWGFIGPVMMLAGGGALEWRKRTQIPGLREPAWYTLTSRRAIIATQPAKGPRRLVSYPLDASMQVEMWPDRPPSILFGPDMGRAAIRPGFRYIPDAEKVMEMIRKVQANAPEARP